MTSLLADNLRFSETETTGRSAGGGGGFDVIFQSKGIPNKFYAILDNFCRLSSLGGQVLPVGLSLAVSNSQL